jgi:glycine/D-amino acid oxidase-like deaminating enzyme
VARTTFAVVGGGILGSAVAHEIRARDAEALITLLDRDELGAGASGRSAGLHIPAGGTETVREMVVLSEGRYAKLAEEHPQLPLYPVGMAVVAAKSNAARLEAWALPGRLTPADPEPGVGSGLTSSADLREPLGGGLVRVPEGCGVWNLEGCHYADVRGVARVLARELSPGITVRENVRVDGIETEGAEVVLRLGTGETLTVDRVVLAPGPWLGAPAWAGLLAPLGVRVKKIVALHLEHRPAEHDAGVYFPDDDAFLLPLAHRGHWLFSNTCREWDVDPDDLHAGLTADDVEHAREVLRRYVPGAAAAPAANGASSGDGASAAAPVLVSGRVFCDAYGPDGRPLVRTVDAAGRIVFAGAANGSGYRLAPALAAAAADLLQIPSERRSDG